MLEPALDDSARLAKLISVEVSPHWHIEGYLKSGFESSYVNVLELCVIGADSSLDPENRLAEGPTVPSPRLVKSINQSKLSARPTGLLLDYPGCTDASAAKYTLFHRSDTLGSDCY